MSSSLERLQRMLDAVRDARAAIPNKIREPLTADNIERVKRGDTIYLRHKDPFDGTVMQDRYTVHQLGWRTKEMTLRHQTDHFPESVYIVLRWDQLCDLDAEWVH